MKILVIEDDAGLNRGLAFALSQDGYELLTAASVREGLRIFHKEQPDGVILDLNLPDGDGIDVCRKIRETSGAAILMLTARDMEVDEIMGLKSGADDYMTKPFSISVLKIRLENLLRRKNRIKTDAEESSRERALVSGSIRLYPGNMRVYRRDEALDLSLTEFRLLQYFMENKNQVLLKERILERIWDDDGNFVEENTLSVNISRLRRKIGENHIRTIHGMGYLWEDSLGQTKFWL